MSRALNWDDEASYDWGFVGPAVVCGAGERVTGLKAAMACLAAIETEIGQHYTTQLADFGYDDPQLSSLIKEFRGERERQRTALAAGAEHAPA